MVLLGVMGVLGCAVESQAGPINLLGLQAASRAASGHSSFSMRDEFAPLGYPGRAPRFQNWSQAMLLGIDTTPDSLILDNHSRVAGMSELPLSGHYAQLEWGKDQCDGDPCRATVPEPTAATLLAIGSGLAAVSTRLRRRQ
jgi:hypothetical protein